jgi:L-iditol 2-dehydrogenase
VKAVQVRGRGEVELIDAPEPIAGPGEVMVEVARAALCATDRRLLDKDLERPRIPGHEVSGRTPDGVLVGVHPDVGCGRCRFCDAGLENRCPDRLSIGLDRDGGLAQWLVVPDGHAIPLDGVNDSIAPMLEPLACCLHAARMLGSERGDGAVVVGAGPMGILSLWALQAEGVRVAVCQRSTARRMLASKLGADSILGPDEDPAVALGGPVRVAIVTAPGADALNWALHAVDVGGKVHAFAGAPHGAAIDANVVHYRHISLVGSTGSTSSDYRRAIDLVVLGRIDLGRMPSQTVALDEVPHALKHRPRDDVLKVMVDIGGDAP